MNAKSKHRLENLDVDSGTIDDPKTRDDVDFLLTSVEQFANEINQLEEQNQHLKDEINRLKGEQGKPSIRPQKKDGDVSSENERKNSKSGKPKKRKTKKGAVQPTRTERCVIDKDSLPEDAISKGIDSIIIQDIIFQAENIEFEREVYYSPASKKRFLAPLPQGYQGEFGPNIKTLILCLYTDSKISQPALWRLLNTVGVSISKATISRIITDGISVFHEEKASIIEAGFSSTDYQHIDDTGARVNGKNYNTHVLCNPYYTAYFTRSSKDRLTVLKLLAGDDLTFLFSEESLLLMQHSGLPESRLNELKTLSDPPRVMIESEVDSLLENLYPNKNKHHKNRKLIKDLSAITAYRHQDNATKILLCDDAPQFKGLTDFLSLCWVHEGRHYKKVRPFMGINRTKLEDFIQEFWNLYRELLAYKESPSEWYAKEISADFDTLFSQKTGYDLLDKRLIKTQAKKEELLLVLDFPHLPLHNNPAELGARAQARKRDVSLQTKNDKGTESKDSMMTVVETAKKLGINTYHYIQDRISKTFKMPSLASLILSRSSS